jgi:4-hydroxy-3-methylbut-2-enyl diphosphate reductase
MYYIEDLSEIDYAWLDGAEKIGISGATSTPQWYMEKVKDAIEQWAKEEKKVEEPVTA